MCRARAAPLAGKDVDRGQPGAMGLVGDGVRSLTEDFKQLVARIPLEDDAIVTERGVEWLAPVNERILLIK